jgi:hypothetical protein
MSKLLRFSIKMFVKEFHSLHCRKTLNGLQTKGLRTKGKLPQNFVYALWRKSLNSYGVFTDMTSVYLQVN